jgi:hypothetical protein
VNIIEAMRDPNLFGNWFASETWAVWRAFLASLFALKMTGKQKAMYCRFTGRVTLPQEPAKEAWVVVGRRGGKSLVAALAATFLACFRDYSALLAPGEVATVMVIAADRRQARVVMRYIAGFLESAPMLASMITKRTQEAIHLNNRVVIEIHTCNFRAIRGYTIAAVVCDEIAFWRSEDSANPDAEILNAIRPGMATIRGGLLLCISSPYARRGALWEVYKNHYGKDGDAVLVWQAGTASMNPSVDPQIIADAYRDDEAVAAAEYGGEFRRDIESFVSREAIESVVVPGRYELPPVSEVRYRAFVDPSGGTADSMTLAVGHREDGRIVLDALRESKPPFSPEQVVREYSSLMDRYRIHVVTGDRYGGDWPREQFRNNGIRYDVSDLVKTDLYRELLPSINSARIELLDHPRMVSQMLGLERRTTRGGRDSIDHGPQGHDDLANVVAGVHYLAEKKRSEPFFF